MIHLRDLSDVYRPRYMWIWWLSAFKAGFINSAGFLVTGSYVSHVTGFGTQVGIALGHRDYFFGIELLVIPFAFIMGGVVTSLILDYGKKSKEPPPYFLVQGLITGIIGLVLIMGESRFGSLVPEVPHPTQYGYFEFTIITLLCFVCGLLNSLVAWITGGKIRVTHLTGLSTDIGLNFLKMIPSKNNPYFVEAEQRANFVRVFIFIFFSIGACSSALILPQLGYNGFSIILFISVLLTVVAFRDRRRMILESFPQLQYELKFESQNSFSSNLNGSNVLTPSRDPQVSRISERQR